MKVSRSCSKFTSSFHLSFLLKLTGLILDPAATSPSLTSHTAKERKAIVTGKSACPPLFTCTICTWDWILIDKGLQLSLFNVNFVACDHLLCRHRPVWDPPVSRLLLCGALQAARQAAGLFEIEIFYFFISIAMLEWKAMTTVFQTKAGHLFFLMSLVLVLL